MTAFTLHPKNPFEGWLRVAGTLGLFASMLTFGIVRAHGQEPTRYGRPDACTVTVGGCSGVCVSSEGHVLTANHCHHADVEFVTFPDGKRVSARKVYDDGSADGCRVFDCDGDGYPYVDVSKEYPKCGDKVFSYGWPIRESPGTPDTPKVRKLESAQGELLRGEIETDPKTGTSFLVNVPGQSLRGSWLVRRAALQPEA